MLIAIAERIEDIKGVDAALKKGKAARSLSLGEAIYAAGADRLKRVGARANVDKVKTAVMACVPRRNAATVR